MPDWPWIENRLDRRTRIARLYRDALAECDPDECADLDEMLDRYGQHWITGNKPHHLDPDQPMTAKQIADWTDTTIQNITNRIANWNIQPVGRVKQPGRGGKLYLLAQFTEKPPTSIKTVV